MRWGRAAMSELGRLAEALVNARGDDSFERACAKLDEAVARYVGVCEFCEVETTKLDVCLSCRSVACPRCDRSHYCPGPGKGPARLRWRADDYWDKNPEATS